MRSEQEIRARVYQINTRLSGILSIPGVGGAVEYQALTEERKALEWVLEEES